MIRWTCLLPTDTLSPTQPLRVQELCGQCPGIWILQTPRDSEAALQTWRTSNMEKKQGSPWSAPQQAHSPPSPQVTKHTLSKSELLSFCCRQSMCPGGFTALNREAQTTNRPLPGGGEMRCSLLQDASKPKGPQAFQFSFPAFEETATLSLALNPASGCHVHTEANPGPLGLALQFSHYSGSQKAGP